MQLLEKAREHISRYEFSQAIGTCKSILSSSEKCSEAYELLLEILKASDHIDYNKYLEDYLYFLKDREDFESFYLYFQTIELTNKKVSIAMRMDYLLSIWKLGRLSEFYAECEKLHAFCIDQKYFNKLEEVIAFVEGYSQEQSYLLRGKIIFYCETNNQEKLDQVLSSFFRDSVYSCKSWDQVNLDELEALRNLLKLYKEQSVVNLREFFRIEIIYQLLGQIDKKIPIKSILDFLLMSQHSEDIYLLYEREGHLIVEDAIGTYIESKFHQKLNKIPFIFEKTRDLFSTKMTMAVVDHSEEFKTEDDVETPKLYNISLEKQEFASRSTRQRKVITGLEKELLTQLKYEEYDQRTLNSLIVSFIEMDLLMTALELCSKLEESSNKYYITAQINLNLGNYAEVIIVVNDSFSRFDLSEVEKTPFNYLKALAFEHLDDNEKAQELFKLMAASDPGFMDVRSKIFR